MMSARALFAPQMVVGRLKAVVACVGGRSSGGSCGFAGARILVTCEIAPNSRLDASCFGPFLTDIDCQICGLTLRHGEEDHG